MQLNFRTDIKIEIQVWSQNDNSSLEIILKMNSIQYLMTVGLNFFNQKLTLMLGLMPQTLMDGYTDKKIRFLYHSCFLEQMQ